MAMRIRLTLVGLVALAGAAWAQGPTSVALVNIEQILTEARPVRAAIDSVDSEVAARQRHLAQREDELSELIESYRSQSALWSEEARSANQRDIIERRMELDEAESDLRRLLDEKEEQVITPTFEKIYQAIRHIAEENDIDIVLRSDAAVYAVTDLDLTAEVIEYINTQMTDDFNLPDLNAL